MVTCSKRVEEIKVLDLRAYEKVSSMKSLTSYNTVFTHRAIRLSVRQKLVADSGMTIQQQGSISAGHTRTT